MKRSDAVLVYSDEHGIRHCRLCSQIENNDFSCTRCIKQDNDEYMCCSYSTSYRKYNKGFHFDNSVHTILVSFNTCNLLPNCIRKGNCSFYKYIQNNYINMDHVEEE